MFLLPYLTTPVMAFLTIFLVKFETLGIEAYVVTDCIRASLHFTMSLKPNVK